MTIEKNTLRTLVMLQADPSRNPRPRRMIDLFKKNGFFVDVVSFPITGKLDYDAHYEMRQPSPALHSKILRKLIGMTGLLLPFEFLSNWLGDLRWGLSALSRKLKDQKYDLIVVEDVYLLPMAFRIRGDARIVFDAREFYPEELGNSLFWRMTEKPMRTRICNKYLQRCDAVMTVSKGLVRRYEDDFKISPILMRSMPIFHDLHPTPIRPDVIRIVHLGVANRDRKLEQMIDIIDQLDSRFKLDIYLAGDASYITDLREYAAQNARVKICDPVEFNSIIPNLNAYDMGFCYLEPTTFNLKNCLPNKFFEAIQARLALIVGPTPDMAELVRKYECGVISPEFKIETVVRMLNALTIDEITQMKEGSHRAARELCYENESEKILDIISGFYSFSRETLSPSYAGL